MLWYTAPERCDCSQANAFWKAFDIEQEKAKRKEKIQEKQEHVKKRIDRLIKNSGIRSRFLNRTFERFKVNADNEKAYKIAKHYAENFDSYLPKVTGNKITEPMNEQNGLFITGGYGTGKTHLATAIANELLSKGTAVICMTMIELLGRIKQTFDNSEAGSEAEIMRIYEDVPLLIIDDIGSEQPTEWGISKIYEIINARYEGYMPTIITTNYSGDDLIKRMTPKDGDNRNASKTLDRLKEMCIGLVMDWESYREK